MSSLDLQSLGAKLVIYGEIDNPDRSHINPSIAFHKGELKIAIRECNFGINKSGNWFFRDDNAYSKTDVLYGDLDPDSLNVSNLNKLTLSADSPTRIKVSGLEDVRLFSRKDGIHALGFESDRLSRSIHNRSTSLADYLITGNELKYIRTLKKPNIDTVEKNWQPVDVETEYFEFTYSPTQVWQGGHLLGDKYTGEVHGGSQLLLQEDGSYISLVHQKIQDLRFGKVYDRFVYYTYLARHDENGFITHLSKPFNFGTKENIEFAAGMVEYKGYLIISFGIRDAKYGICKIKKETLINLLEVRERV